MSAEQTAPRGAADGLAILRDAVRGARSAVISDGVLRLSRLNEDDLRYAADDGLARVAGQLSGVRLHLRTRAEWIELEVFVTRQAFSAPGKPWRPARLEATIQGREVAHADVDSGTRVEIAPDGSRTVMPGPSERVRLHLGVAGSERDVELWLPHNAALEILSVRASHPLAASPAGDAPRWVHHGSSISQCANADSPREVWPVIAADRLRWQLSSYGLAGQAMVDPLVARAIAETDADLVTVKLGINLVNAAAMTERTLTPAVHGFLDIVRAGQPGTPIVLVSPIACPMHENVPGPTIAGEGLSRVPRLGGSESLPGALTLSGIRLALARVVETRRDPLLWYLDGRELFGEADASHLYDNLHPDPSGYRLIGERFAALAASAAWYPGSRTTAPHPRSTED